MLAGLTFLAAACLAQEDRPQITTLPRKIQKKKKDEGPRAVGVLQMAASGKVSLVPIAIMINGKFWDATAYKADPVPMALEPGTVYEGERGGSSLGLFTVGSALHSNAPNAPNPWIGTGAWLPEGSEKPGKQLKAEAVPVGIDTSDAPPRLTRDPAQATPAASSTPAPSSAPPAAAPSGDEPPRLKKPAAPPAPPSGDSKPSEAKDEAKANPKTPESDSGAAESDRPRLRRGKPAEPPADDAFPGYSKPGTKPASTAGKVVAPVLAGAPAEIVPAISDAGGPEPHSFAYGWLKDEEGERRQAMMALAKEQLLAYLDAQAKARIAPPPSQPARHKTAGKPPEPVFSNVQMIAYDLWSNNQPVIILSAEAHVPPARGPTLPVQVVPDDLPYFIRLVAYPDIYNNLHKLYAGVTDPRHLDVTSRLDLVDAVDADGDGRGELLFKETSDQGSGWVIYRPTADKLWKMFDSLNPE